MANKEDHPTWDEAMNGPNKAGYWQACIDEINTLTDMDAFEVVK
jgi:hypothetical protein